MSIHDRDYLWTAHGHSCLVIMAAVAPKSGPIPWHMSIHDRDYLWPAHGHSCLVIMAAVAPKSSIDGTYTKSLRRVGSARGCSEASDISHRGCSEASRQRSCLRKPGGSSRMALGRAGGHVQCRARGGGGIARARSRLASSGCQGKISNHLLYRRSYT